MKKETDGGEGEREKTREEEKKTTKNILYNLESSIFARSQNASGREDVGIQRRDACM